jgi:hypothetical protein
MLKTSNSSNTIASLSTSLDVRNARRLSKQSAVASSTSSLTLKSMGTEHDSDTPSGLSTHLYERPEMVVTSPEGVSRSRRNSRHKIKAHLFGSSQESLEEDSEDSEGRRGLASTARGMRERISRTGSMVTRRASIRLSISPLNNSQSRLSLVQESSSLYDQEDSERVVEQIKEKAYQDALAARNHVQPAVDEDMHADAVTSPIRRSSLFTPGIATRAPDDILRRLPPPESAQTEAERDYFYNPNRPKSSPLSAIASLNPNLHAPIPRPYTPTDLDYSHLGGLGLGTLRITNGACSPISIARVRTPTTVDRETSPSRASSRYPEDYFNSADGQHEDYNDLTNAFKDIQIPSGGFIDDLDISSFSANNDGNSTRVGRTPWVSNEFGRVSRGGSPLKYQAKPEDIVEIKEPTRLPPKPPRPMSLTQCDGPDYTAQEYISELPDSPYSFTTAGPSKSISPTTKANEFEDKLFDDEETRNPSIMDRPRPKKRNRGSSTVQNADEALAQGYSPDVSGEDDMDTPLRAIPKMSSSDRAHLSVSTVESTSSNSSLTKKDSGYSSSTSARSSKRNTLPAKIENTPLRPALRSSMKTPISLTIPKSPDGPRDMYYRTLSTSLPPPPRPWVLGESIVNAGNGTPVSSTQSSSIRTPTISAPSSPISPSGLRKLKKARPLSLPPPVHTIVVQSYREIDDSTIPPVTPEVASRHEQRLRDFPLLEHTFPSLDHTDLRDDSTSPELVFVPIRFPSPTRGPKDEEDLKANDEAYRSGRPRNSSNNSDFNPLTSNPVPHQSQGRQSDDYLVSNFGDVSTSLGGSPYDAARHSIPPTPRASSNNNRPSGHLTPDPKPRVRKGMDGEQAAEFARLRSQYRSMSMSRMEEASQSYELEACAHEFHRPAMPTLPTESSSSSSTVPTRGRPVLRHSFDDRGGVPGKMPKTNSLASPPVPPLPFSPQARQKEHLHHCTNCGHIEPVNLSPNWESQRQSWSERRQRAGEGLQTSMHQRSQSSAPTRSSFQQEIPPKSQTPEEPVRAPPPPPHSPTPKSSTTSLKEPPSADTDAHRLLGRFDGGLSFGYEPGYGIGGSAGLRGPKTEASRKSVDVSRGYGVDLSDIPIFVAPSS